VREAVPLHLLLSAEPGRSLLRPAVVGQKPGGSQVKAVGGSGSPGTLGCPFVILISSLESSISPMSGHARPWQKP